MELAGQADTNARYLALGELVDAASTFEMQLRAALCALVGSKYAAVIAAGMMAGELIENSAAVAKRHREITEPARSRLTEILSLAKALSEARNRLIHDVWAFGGPEGPVLMRSKRRDHTLPTSGTSVAAVQETAQALRAVTFDLHEALRDAFGLEIATIESQLRWEDHVATMTLEEREALARRQATAAEKMKQHGE
uniref:hypothetical protein n=1 Tax=Paractinoplanes polyasparticus TaxID=2856853 RepID=UPI001C841DA6|nr:hypothetical protein [Actinoplanes polyasparticus]